jgi:hypothetical protein
MKITDGRMTDDRGTLNAFQERQIEKYYDIL